MEAVLSGLCLLAFVLVVVTLIGHGLWVLAATMFRGLAGQSTATSAPASRTCPACGRVGTTVGGRCQLCGAATSIAPPDGLKQDLEATTRHLERMLRRGIIQPDEHQRMVDSIRADLARLAEPGIRRQETGVRGQEAAVPQAAHDVVDAIIVEEPAPTSDLRPPTSDLRRPTSDLPPPTSAPVGSSPFAPVRRPGEVHPLDLPEPKKAPLPPQPSAPRRTLADMLQSFMEESNIRWGEVISGALIVICAIGLVISLRATLDNIPYFPALLFMIFTVAFHGAGLYSLKRWNLHAISRVILIIALLLVPLGFSAGIVLSGSRQAQREITDPYFIAAVLVGTLAFGWVTASAARETVGRGWWRLSIGVLGASLSQVLISRLGDEPTSLVRALALSGLPLGCFLVAAGGQVAHAAARERLNPRRIAELLLIVGIAAFALAVPLALLVHLSPSRLLTVARLSPAISLGAAAVLAAGLLVHGRATSKPLAMHRFIGTAVAAGAGLTMLIAVALAWPRPELLLVVGAANAVVLLGLALASRIAPLHAAALACAALAALIGVHLGVGKLRLGDADRDILAHALATCRSGIVLTGLAVIAAGAAWLLGQKGRRQERLVYIWSAAALAAISGLLAAFVGFVPGELWTIESAADARWAAPLLLIHAAALIAAAPRLKHVAATVIGAAFLWLGLVHAVAWNDVVRQGLASAGLLPARPVLWATIVHSLLMAVGAVAAAGRGAFTAGGARDELDASPRWRLLVVPLSIAALVALIGSLPFVVWVRPAELYAHASYAACGAAVCLALFVVWRDVVVFAGVQGLAALAAAFFTAGLTRSLLGNPAWHLDWLHSDAQLATIALGAALWSGVRDYARRWPAIHSRLGGPELTVDTALLAVAAFAAPLMAIAGAWPEVASELDAGTLAAGLSRQAWPYFAGGIGDWLAVGAIGAALLLWLGQGRHREALAGLMAVTFAIPWLIAGLFADEVAAGSAARWLVGGYVAAFCAMSIGARWLARREDWLGQLGIMAARPQLAIWPFVAGAAAILAITIAVVVQALNQNTAGGPLAESWFAAIGPTLSFGIPLSVLVVVSLVFSIAWRQAGMSIVAAALFQLTANLAFLIHLPSIAPDVPLRWAQWLQWNAVALGLFGVVWSAVDWLKSRRRSDSPAARLQVQLERTGLYVQTILAGAAMLASAVWAALAVVVEPGREVLITSQLGHWTSYAAVGLALTLVLWRLPGRLSLTPTLVGDAIVALGCMLVAFAAASSDAFDPGRQWLAYHVLMIGMLVIAAAATAWHAAGRLNLPAIPGHWSAAAIAGFVVLLAVRSLGSDPQAPWWGASAAAGAALLYNALGVVSRRQVYAYLGTVLAALPVALFLFDAWTWTQPWPRVLGEVCLIAILAVALFWLWLEVRAQRRTNASFGVERFLPAVHQPAGLAGLVVAALLVAGRLLMALIQTTRPISLPTQTFVDVALGITLLVLLVLLAASLWDRRALHTIPGLYCGGLIVTGYSLYLLRWTILSRAAAARPEVTYTELLAAAAPLGVAIYVALTGELWNRGARLARAGDRLGIAGSVGGLTRTALWLPAASILLTVGICSLSFLSVLGLDSLPLRVMAALAPAIAAWGLARQAQQWREVPLQMASLGLAGLSAVLLGWSEQPPLHTDALWMTRMFRLLMVLSALTFLYGLALPRFLFVSGSWNTSSRRAGYGAAVLAMATFLAVLALELVWFDAQRGAPVAAAQVVAVAALLAALIAGLISLALFADRDPLGLSERGRMGYVYAAEAVLALLFAHLYLCKPMWFSGILRPYWPYVIMAIAFVGVGAGEIFQRMRLRVLAEPLRNTGALLPLLPALGMWVLAPTESDYSLVLFLVGAIYLVVSVTQRSWIAAAAAGVAGNGALWSLLHDTNWEFMRHPQLWLIPPAASVLIAAHVNRRRLDPQALAAIRYAATIVIYLSSTSEIFLRGIGNALWPPMVLLALSLAGALLGIMLRIRAFLYLGSGFALMALITMVWHASAAIEQTWPWWLFGIGAGIALLALFALFEKKRTEMTALIAHLRQWEQ